MLDDLDALKALAREVDRDSRATIAAYDIRDKASLQGLLAAQIAAANLEGRFADALDLTLRSAALDDKPALKLTADIEARALLAASRATSPEAAREAYRRSVDASLADLPAEVVRPRLIEMRANIDRTTPARRRAQVAIYLDPVWKPGVKMPADYALWTLQVAARERVSAPYLPILREALTAWMSTHPASPDSDIWAARSVTFTAADRPAPVAIGIWDAGVDAAAFKGRNTVSKGLAYDERFLPTGDALKPVPTALQPQMDDLARSTRGLGDLMAGLDTPDVDFFRKQMAALAIEQFDAYDAAARFYFTRSHGTLVADIASRGDPAIRIVPIRITFSDAAVPPPMDEAAVDRLLASARTSVAYMKSEGVRVANMSWGYTARDIEDSLAANNIEADPAKRATRAQAIFDRLFDGMSEVMAGAPEILFVIAAGNANQDLDFVRDMPGSINLPNVLSVAAVDQAGVLTTFASSGPSVDLYALGENVEAMVPGGTLLRASGASLSAPQVVNAAAKVLSVRPDLSTAELVKILVSTATKSADGLLLLNPRAAVEAARAR